MVSGCDHVRWRVHLSLKIFSPKKFCPRINNWTVLFKFSVRCCKFLSYQTKMPDSNCGNLEKCNKLTNSTCTNSNIQESVRRRFWASIMCYFLKWELRIMAKGERIEFDLVDEVYLYVDITIVVILIFFCPSYSWKLIIDFSVIFILIVCCYFKTNYIQKILLN